MKLVATRWICDQTPEGATFDVPDLDAHLLIDMGLARPVPANDDPAIRPEGRPARGRYRRRDLTASESA